MAKQKKGKAAPYVIVTTQHRGVFAGRLVADRGDVVVIDEARICVYWSADCRGIVGLAASGPTKGCKISPAAPSITLRGVTAIVRCSEEARARWEEAPWA